MTIDLYNRYGLNDKEFCDAFELDIERLQAWLNSDPESTPGDQKSQEKRAIIGCYRVFHFLSEQLPQGESAKKWMQTYHPNSPFSQKTPLQCIKQTGFEGLNKLYKYLCETYWPKAYQKL